MKDRKVQRQARGQAPVAGGAHSRTWSRFATLAGTLALIGVLVWLLLPDASGSGKGSGAAREQAAEGVSEVTATIAGPPPAHFDPSELDLGRVETLSTITRTVHLVNTSDRTLRVQAVRGNCSCVRGDVGGRNLLPPRGSLPVTVEFDTLANPQFKAVGVNVVISGFEEPVSLPVSATIIRSPSER